MDYYCEVCIKNIKAKNKYKHFKSKSHIQFDKCKHITLCHKDFDINDVDEAFYLHIIEHKKKFDYSLIICEFKLVFNDYEYFPYVTSKLSDNKTLIPWKSWLEEIIEDFENQGYIFSHIAEMHNITIAIKIDISYDFYIKLNMCALEWELNTMINKNKTLQQ